MRTIVVVVTVALFWAIFTDISALPKHKKGRKDDADDDSDDDDDESEERKSKAWIEKVEHAAKEYRELAVKLHNEYRALHDAPPLRLKKRLNRIALAYAQKLIRENRYVNEVSFKEGEKPYLQNVYYQMDTGVCCPPSPLTVMKTAVETWYNEINIYDWNNPSPTTFSQLVWKDTTRIGVGMAISKRENNFTQVVVAAYSPPGNINEASCFKVNVLPRKEKQCC